MTIRSNKTDAHADAPWKPAGTGLALRWSCMGCNTPRDPAGSKGAGLRRRCAACLAAKAPKAGRTGYGR